jgi:hypothetical protein
MRFFMQIKKHVSRFWVLAVTVVALTFGGCQNQAPLSQSSDMPDGGEVVAPGESAQFVLDSGPLSWEQAEAITAPEEKVQVAGKDLKILKSIDPVSLQKRFVTSWHIPVGARGWAYAGDKEHGRCWLFFPRHALDKETVITIDWESSGFLEGGVEFSPHGAEFNRPVMLWISYKDADLRGIDEEDLRIWYLNEDTEMWELIGDVVDTRNKMVGGLLHHFSRYAIGME